MKPKDPDALSWTLRFILICVSFFIFSWLTKFLGGEATHVSAFAKIGFIALGLAVISFIAELIAAYLAKGENTPAPIEQDDLF
jgi:hypothetical protein